MNFDILGKDIAVLFILAVIFGIATYFYVLHKGKKEKRTASIQQYQADIQYVIFVSKMVVKILKTSSIPDILTEKNYQNFATLPVIGLTIKYGGGGSISF